MILICALCGGTTPPFVALGVPIVCYRPDDDTTNCYKKVTDNGQALQDGTTWDGNRWAAP